MERSALGKAAAALVELAAANPSARADALFEVLSLAQAHDYALYALSSPPVITQLQRLSNEATGEAAGILAWIIKGLAENHDCRPAVTTTAVSQSLLGMLASDQQEPRVKAAASRALGAIADEAADRACSTLGLEVVEQAARADPAAAAAVQRHQALATLSNRLMLPPQQQHQQRQQLSLPGTVTASSAPNCTAALVSTGPSARGPLERSAVRGGVTSASLPGGFNFSSRSSRHAMSGPRSQSTAEASRLPSTTAASRNTAAVRPSVGGGLFGSRQSAAGSSTTSFSTCGTSSVMGTSSSPNSLSGDSTAGGSAAGFIFGEAAATGFSFGAATRHGIGAATGFSSGAATSIGSGAGMGFSLGRSGYIKERTKGKEKSAIGKSKLDAVDESPKQAEHPAGPHAYEVARLGSSVSSIFDLASSGSTHTSSNKQTSQRLDCVFAPLAICQDAVPFTGVVTDIRFTLQALAKGEKAKAPGSWDVDSWPSGHWALVVLMRAKGDAGGDDGQCFTPTGIARTIDLSQLGPQDKVNNLDLDVSTANDSAGKHSFGKDDVAAMRSRHRQYAIKLQHSLPVEAGEFLALWTMQECLACQICFTRLSRAPKATVAETPDEQHCRGYSAVIHLPNDEGDTKTTDVTDQKRSSARRTLPRRPFRARVEDHCVAFDYVLLNQPYERVEQEAVKSSEIGMIEDKQRSGGVRSIPHGLHCLQIRAAIAGEDAAKQDCRVVDWDMVLSACAESDAEVDLLDALSSAGFSGLSYDSIVSLQIFAGHKCFTSSITGTVKCGYACALLNTGALVRFTTASDTQKVAFSDSNQRWHKDPDWNFGTQCLDTGSKQYIDSKENCYWMEQPDGSYVRQPSEPKSDSDSLSSCTIGPVAVCDTEGKQVVSISCASDGLLCLTSCGSIYLWRWGDSNKLEPHPVTSWLKLQDNEKIVLTASSESMISICTRMENGNNRVASFLECGAAVHVACPQLSSDMSEPSVEESADDSILHGRCHVAIQQQPQTLPADSGQVEQMVVSGTLTGVLTSTGSIFYSGCANEARTVQSLPQLRTTGHSIKPCAGDYVNLKTATVFLKLSSCSSIVHLQKHIVGKVVGHVPDAWVVHTDQDSVTSGELDPAQQAAMIMKKVQLQVSSTAEGGAYSKNHLLTDNLDTAWAPKIRVSESQRFPSMGSSTPRNLSTGRQLRKDRAKLASEWVQLSLPEGVRFKTISIVTARPDEHSSPQTFGLKLGACEDTLEAAGQRTVDLSGSDSYITTCIFDVDTMPGVVCTAMVARIMLTPAVYDGSKPGMGLFPSSFSCKHHPGSIRRILLSFANDPIWKMEDCMILTPPAMASLGRIVKSDHNFALVSRVDETTCGSNLNEINHMLDQCDIYALDSLVTTAAPGASSDTDANASTSRRGISTLQDMCQRTYESVIRHTIVEPVAIDLDTTDGLTSNAGQVQGIALDRDYLITVADRSEPSNSNFAQSGVVHQVVFTQRKLNLMSPVDPGHTNDEGAKVAPGRDASCCHLFYCGRHIGARQLPGSDGFCGPSNGPQCQSCTRYSDSIARYRQHHNDITIKHWSETLQGDYKTDALQTLELGSSPMGYLLRINKHRSQIVGSRGTPLADRRFRSIQSAAPSFVPPLHSLATYGSAKSHLVCKQQLALIFTEQPLLKAVRADDFDEVVRLSKCFGSAPAALVELRDQYARNMLHLVSVGLLHQILYDKVLLDWASLAFSKLLCQVDAQGRTPIVAAADRRDYILVHMFLRLAARVCESATAYFSSLADPGALFTAIAGELAELPKSVGPSQFSLTGGGSIRPGAIVRAKATIDFPAYGWQMATPFSIGQVKSVSGDRAMVQLQGDGTSKDIWKVRQSDLECCSPSHETRYTRYSALFEADISKYPVKKWSKPTSAAAVVIAATGTNAKLTQRREHAARILATVGSVETSNGVSTDSSGSSEQPRRPLRFETPIPFGIARKINKVLYDEDLRDAHFLRRYACAIDSGDDSILQDVPLALLMGEAMFEVAVTRHFRMVVLDNILGCISASPSLLQCTFCSTLPQDCLFTRLVLQREDAAAETIIEAITVLLKDEEHADLREKFAVGAVRNLMYLLGPDHGNDDDRFTQILMSLVRLAQTAPESLTELNEQGHSLPHLCWMRNRPNVFSFVIETLNVQDVLRARALAEEIFLPQTADGNRSLPSGKPLLHRMVAGIREDHSLQNRFFVLTRAEQRIIERTVNFVKKVVPSALVLLDTNGMAPFVKAIACFQYSVAVTVLGAVFSTFGAAEDSLFLDGNRRSALEHLVRNARGCPAVDEGCGRQFQAESSLARVYDRTNESSFQKLVTFVCQQTGLTGVPGEDGRPPFQLLLWLKGGNTRQVELLFKELLTFESAHNAFVKGTDRLVLAATVLTGAEHLVQAILGLLESTANQIGKTTEKSHTVSLNYVITLNEDDDTLWNLRIAARPPAPQHDQVEAVIRTLVIAAVRIASICEVRQNLTSDQPATIVQNVRKLFAAFPLISIHELAKAAAAVITPVRLGVVPADLAVDTVSAVNSFFASPQQTGNGIDADSLSEQDITAFVAKITLHGHEVCNSLTGQEMLSAVFRGLSRELITIRTALRCEQSQQLARCAETFSEEKDGDDRVDQQMRILDDQILSIYTDCWRWLSTALDFTEARIQAELLQRTTHNGLPPPNSFEGYLLDILDEDTKVTASLRQYGHFAQVLDGFWILLAGWVDPTDSEKAESTPSLGKSDRRNTAVCTGQDASRTGFFGRRRSLLHSKQTGTLPLASNPNLLFTATRSACFGQPDPMKNIKWPTVSVRTDANSALALSPPPRPTSLLERWPLAGRGLARLHYKVLSRQQPTGGSFVSVAADFDTRAQCFNEEMRRTREENSSLELQVDRNHLLAQSLQQITDVVTTRQNRRPDRNSTSVGAEVSVSFSNEQGRGPGVNRGWFTAVAMALAAGADVRVQSKQTRVCFASAAHSEEVPLFWEPQAHTGLFALNPQRMDQCNYGKYIDATEASTVPASGCARVYRAIGQFLGLCLVNDQTIPMQLTRPTLKSLLNRPLCFTDLQFYDPSIALSLEKLLTFPPTEIEDQELFFTAVVGGVDGVEVELVPGGKRLAVDSSNVHQYVEAYSRHLMVGSCKAGLVAMRAGLLDVVPESALELLTAEDMTLILHGSGGIALNMGALKERTAVNFAIEVTADEATKYEDMLWAVIAEFSDADRRQLLHFATGSTNLPHGRGTSTLLKISINGPSEALATATTCSREMSMPMYPDHATMKAKLLLAIHHCVTYENN